jgi:putative transposase
MRTAYRCRAYPDQPQQAMLNRTFGCVRVVWNRTLVIDHWYPSSKTCSACGYLLAELSLGARHWTCPSCGTRR